MKITNELLLEAAEYVKQYMQENGNALFSYHNYNHTFNVARACDTISAHTNLDEQARMTLQLAAWFHDIGYFSNPAEHEKIGAAMAAVYFKKKGLEKNTITDIGKCILA